MAPVNVCQSKRIIIQMQIFSINDIIYSSIKSWESFGGFHRRLPVQSVFPVCVKVYIVICLRPTNIFARIQFGRSTRPVFSLLCAGVQLSLFFNGYPFAICKSIVKADVSRYYTCSIYCL